MENKVSKNNNNKTPPKKGGKYTNCIQLELWKSGSQGIVVRSRGGEGVGVCGRCQIIPELIEGEKKCFQTLVIWSRIQAGDRQKKKFDNYSSRLAGSVILVNFALFWHRSPIEVQLFMLLFISGDIRKAMTFNSSLSSYYCYYHSTDEQRTNTNNIRASERRSV